MPRRLLKRSPLQVEHSQKLKLLLYVSKSCNYCFIRSCFPITLKCAFLPLFCIPCFSAATKVDTTAQCVCFSPFFSGNVPKLLQQFCAHFQADFAAWIFFFIFSMPRKYDVLLVPSPSTLGVSQFMSAILQQKDTIAVNKNFIIIKRAVILFITCFSYTSLPQFT